MILVPEKRLAELADYRDLSLTLVDPMAVTSLSPYSVGDERIVTRITLEAGAVVLVAGTVAEVVEQMRAAYA